MNPKREAWKDDSVLGENFSGIAFDDGAGASRNAPASERGLREAGDEVEQSPLALEQEFPGPLQPGYVQSQDGNP
jgi:hypothetical protein